MQDFSSVTIHYHLLVAIDTVFLAAENHLPGSSMENALISVPEAAKRLGGISTWTVYAWLSQGRLQRTKVGGRTMIRESELAKVMKDGGKSPSPRSQKG